MVRGIDEHNVQAALIRSAATIADINTEARDTKRWSASSPHHHDDVAEQLAPTCATSTCAPRQRSAPSLRRRKRHSADATASAHVGGIVAGRADSVDGSGGFPRRTRLSFRSWASITCGSRRARADGDRWRADARRGQASAHRRVSSLQSAIPNGFAVGDRGIVALRPVAAGQGGADRPLHRQRASRPTRHSTGATRAARWSTVAGASSGSTRLWRASTWLRVRFNAATRQIIGALMRDGRVRRAYMARWRLRGRGRRGRAGKSGAACRPAREDLIIDLGGSAIERVDDVQRLMTLSAIGERWPVGLSRRWFARPRLEPVVRQPERPHAPPSLAGRCTEPGAGRRFFDAWAGTRRPPPEAPDRSLEIFETLQPWRWRSPACMPKR